MLDPNGEQVGKVRDVVIQNRSGNRRAAGEGPRGRAVRAASDLLPDGARALDRRPPGDHLRPGQHRPLPGARAGDAGGRRPLRPHGRTAPAPSRPETIFDVAIQQQPRPATGMLAEVALREAGPASVPARSRDHRRLVGGARLHRRTRPRDAEQQAMRLSELKPADVARELHDMDPMLRAAVVQRHGRRPAGRGAGGAARGRAGRRDRVPRHRAGRRRPRGDGPRRRRRPDRRAGRRDWRRTSWSGWSRRRPRTSGRCCSYDAATAGGLMNPEPVVLGVDATVADALAAVRRPGDHPGDGGAGLHLPAAAGHPDRPLPRRRPLSSGCCASRRRCWSRG